MKAGMESTVSSTCFHNLKKDFENTKQGWAGEKKKKNGNSLPPAEVNVPERASIRILKCLEYLNLVPKTQ